jgi:hypothetical protein
MYMSHITYTLKLFCDAKTTFLLLVPCHFHKQKLNVRKNTMPLSYMYSNLSLQGGVFKEKQNSNTFMDRKTTHLMNDTN